MKKSEKSVFFRNLPDFPLAPFPRLSRRPRPCRAGAGAPPPPRPPSPTGEGGCGGDKGKTRLPNDLTYCRCLPAARLTCGQPCRRSHGTAKRKGLEWGQSTPNKPFRTNFSFFPARARFSRLICGRSRRRSLGMAKEQGQGRTATRHTPAHPACQPPAAAAQRLPGAPHRLHLRAHSACAAPAASLCLSNLCAI